MTEEKMSNLPPLRAVSVTIQYIETQDEDSGARWANAPSVVVEFNGARIFTGSFPFQESCGNAFDLAYATAAQGLDMLAQEADARAKQADGGEKSTSASARSTMPVYDCADCYAASVEKAGMACEFCQKRHETEHDIGLAALYNEALFWEKISAERAADLLAAAPAPKSFEEVWAEKVTEGYQYGADALEQVKFGWELAMKAVRKEGKP